LLSGPRVRKRCITVSAPLPLRLGHLEPRQRGRKAVAVGVRLVNSRPSRRGRVGPGPGLPDPAEPGPHEPPREPTARGRGQVSRRSLGVRGWFWRPFILWIFVLRVFLPPSRLSHPIRSSQSSARWSNPCAQRYRHHYGYAGCGAAGHLLFQINPTAPPNQKLGLGEGQHFKYLLSPGLEQIHVGALDQVFISYTNFSNQVCGYRLALPSSL